MLDARSWSDAAGAVLALADAAPIPKWTTEAQSAAVPAIVPSALVSVDVRAFRQTRHAVRRSAHLAPAAESPDGERA
jgi:hypothetical protein